ncbi:unnamed protein product [Soboliphyme baturini]|uniref:Piezo-type mechanosensitive ion channel component n=1 Tax=Soboliphyme baturini TaxID=241478 RepID=A0A183I937_9BILA|nr:unnamed protein product [Soboliphyme baturini]
MRGRWLIPWGSRVNLASIGHSIRLLAPDFMVYVTFVITLTVCEAYNRSFASTDQVVDVECSPYERQKPSAGGVSVLRAIFSYRSFRNAVNAVSEVLVVVLLCLVSVAWPSLLSSFYFVVFLGFMTVWAFCLTRSCHCVRVMKTMLISYLAVHLITLYLYQMWPFQNDVEPSTLVGLTPILETNCSSVWAVHFVKQDPAVYGNAVLLFVFYMYLAFQIRYLDKMRVGDSVPDDLVNSGQNGEVFESVSSIHEDLLRFADAEVCGNIETTTAATERNKADVAAGSSDTKTRKQSDLFSHCPLLVDVYALLLRHAYVGSLLVMMAWAITYHSWLSFVWLLLACVIWMCSNSRRTFFFLSPFIVFYAEALLILQFIYGLNLTAAELPDDLPGFPLQQIGLIKPVGPAWVPLFIKVLYSCLFWASMRFFCYERKSLSSGGVSLPGGITIYGTFANYESQSSWLERFMAKYWIYVVGLVLLLISLRQPVFLYNIGYMVFFVTLLTVLQVSFALCRRLLFFYWMVLSAYSIVILWLVYTYQFHGVPEMWRNWTYWSDDV